MRDIFTLRVTFVYMIANKMHEKNRHVRGNRSGYRDFEILKEDNGIYLIFFFMTTLNTVRNRRIFTAELSGSVGPGRLFFHLKDCDQNNLFAESLPIKNLRKFISPFWKVDEQNNKLTNRVFRLQWMLGIVGFVFSKFFPNFFPITPLTRNQFTDVILPDPIPACIANKKL